MIINTAKWSNPCCHILLQLALFTLYAVSGVWYLVSVLLVVVLVAGVPGPLLQLRLLPRPRPRPDRGPAPPPGPGVGAQLGEAAADAPVLDTE